ncbi:hypothetical protein KM1_259350, partial [Entamoeba histolytica HM-3:IMSS]
LTLIIERVTHFYELIDE